MRNRKKRDARINESVEHTKARISDAKNEYEESKKGVVSSNKLTVAQTIKNIVLKFVCVFSVVLITVSVIGIIGMYVLPLISMYIAGAMGISVESSMIDVVCGWLLPSFFTCAMLVIGAFCISKKIFHFFRNLFDKYSS